MIPVALRSVRLVLDQPDAGDVDAIAEACAAPEFERYMATPWPYRRPDAEAFVGTFVPDGWRQGRDLTFSPRLRAGAPLLGMVGLHRHDDGALELGYWLAASARGSGYVTEACRAVLVWAADERLADRFTWRAVVGNDASRSVAQRLGYRMTAVRDSELRDRQVPHWFAELDADEVRTGARS